MKKLLLVICAFAMFQFPVYGLEIGGVPLPDSLTVDGRDLVLNGAGLRKKFFFKIYACGLYLTAKTADAGKIIAADEPMIIRMHFIYKEVESKKLIDGWNEGFEHSTGGNPASMKTEIDAFNALFKEPAKKGDIYDITHIPGKGVQVIKNEKVLGTIPGLSFKKAVFGIWLGEKTELKSLRKKLIGK